MMGEGIGPASVDHQRRSARRLALLGLCFVAALGLVGLRFVEMAAQNDGAGPAPRPGAGAADAGASGDDADDPKGGAPGVARADIRDRNGAVLATDVRTYELYFDSSFLHFDWERDEAIERIGALFPGLDQAQLAKRVRASGTKLIARPITPDMAQAAHDLGIPGLYSTPRLDRIYPGGAAMGKLLGWTNIEGAGKAGVERGMEARLSAEGAAPLALSIDARVQRATRDILRAGVARTGARAGVAIVMDVTTGELLSLVSLPDYDPHNRPPQPQSGDVHEESPLFNHAVQGRYELGSVFKAFTWALAIETGVSGPEETFEPPLPFPVGDYVIRDDYPIRSRVSFADAFAKSSNIVASTLALRAPPGAQRRLLKGLGLDEPTGVEVSEAHRVSPQWTDPWNRTAVAVAAYGHGISATPLHVAASFAALVNGGTRVRPTVLKRDPAEAARRRPPEQVIAPATSRQMRRLLRHVVTSGTGKAAEAPGYQVGGKTGTADKRNPLGGYYDDRVLATFAGAFPMDAPRYAVLAMLDEPTDHSTGQARRGAGLTAAPIIGALVPRIAPLLGVAPRRDAVAMHAPE